MEAIASILGSRMSRMNLDTKKNYIKVHTKEGKTVEEPVGRFVRAYQMGSGEGMTAHWEFMKDGKTIRVDDEFFGALTNKNLLGFREERSVDPVLMSQSYIGPCGPI